MKHYRSRIDKLIGNLSRAEAPPNVEMSGVKPAICTPTAVPDWYVFPTIEMDGDLESASVLVIEGAGAVGKSAAAEAFAAMTNWPLIRADRAQVGSYSLTGLISDAMGLTGDYFARMARGECGLCVDALDEALMRAGSNNFLAFMDNVVDVARSKLKTEGGPILVLFGRSEAAELTVEFLRESGIRVVRGSISFFNRDGADEYVRKYLDRRARESSPPRPEYHIARSHPVAFGRALEERFSAVGRLIAPQEGKFRTDWESAKEFLGYAPVLDAISESVASTNPAAEASSTGLAEDYRLIIDIVEFILYREQRKIQAGVAKKLQAKSDAAADDLQVDSLYGIDEQVARLLGAVESLPLEVALPASLPSEVRETYEESVANFLPDHPFLRGRNFSSVIFSDYAISRLEAPVGRAVTDSWSWSGEVGPFYARMLSKLRDESCLDLDERSVGRLIRWWRAESELLRSTGHVIMMGDNGSLYFQLVRIGDDSPTGAPSQMAAFEWLNHSGVVVLTSPCEDMAVFGDLMLVIEPPGDAPEVILGERLYVMVESLEFDSESLHIRATEQGPAVLNVHEGIASPRLKHIVGSPHLRVISPVDKTHPKLRPFAVEKPQSARVVEFSQYMDLRSILLSFGKSAKGDPTVSKDKLEQAIVKQNPKRKAILDDLVARGVVYSVPDENTYRLRLADLSSLGFGLNDVRDGDLRDGVLRYLSLLPKP